VLNVAAGGDLYQDIPTLIPNSLTHTTVGGRPKSAIAHTVEVKTQTRLALLVGAGELNVNSAHHQAVKDVAPDLIVTARAPDGVIEGIEHTQHPFCIGVQWHPEVMVGEYTIMRRLFEGLIEAAGRQPD
jgi:putative glutamine amidotransferase